MPNWVYNNVSLNVKDEKEAEKIKTFLTDAESIFSFNKIIKRPEAENANWYDWNIANWGTKWDASNTYFATKEDGTLQYSFATAWSPPLPVLRKLSKRFPKVPIYFHFKEEQGWGGETTLLAGDMTLVKEWDIPSSHADMEAIEKETCYCYGNDEQYFDDCYITRASAIQGISAKALEVIKGLAKDWHSSFEDLVETAKIL